LLFCVSLTCQNLTVRQTTQQTTIRLLTWPRTTSLVLAVTWDSAVDGGRTLPVRCPTPRCRWKHLSASRVSLLYSASERTEQSIIDQLLVVSGSSMIQNRHPHYQLLTRPRSTMNRGLSAHCVLLVSNSSNNNNNNN